MNCFLVDYENVCTEGIKDFEGVKDGDIMIIFYSENRQNITLDILNRIMSLNLKYSSFKVKVGTKNALDFQLTSYLGFLIGQYGIETNYYIVSRDKGFEAVCDFWKTKYVSVRCISLKKTEKTEKQKIEAASNELATLKEITSLIGNDNEPEIILEIFNKNNTKQSINNSMSKYFKDNKKTGEIYKKLKPLMKLKSKT